MPDTTLAELSLDPFSPPRETRVLCHARKGHDFQLTYETGSETVVLETLAEMVANPALPFDWFDAATLGHQMGQHLVSEMQAISNSG
jgi:hypothetical protein